MTLRNAVSTITEKLCSDEAFLILEHILSLNRNELLLRLDEKLTEDQEKRTEEFIAGRLCGRPLQYLIGIWPFMNNHFYVGEGVLIPRDDTEVLVNAADHLIKKRKLKKCIDLCSGSGIIAITLKIKNPDTIFTAVEKSEKAFYYLEKNTKHNKTDIKTVLDDILDYCKTVDDSSLDLIVSNPPYVKRDEIKDLQKEISFEPFMALDGGEDGLFFYHAIIDKYTKKLKTGGYAAFEIGEGQKDQIMSMLQNDYTDISVYKDIQNIDRVITAKRI